MPLRKVFLEMTTVTQTSSEIHCILHNPKFHYHIHKGSQLNPILTQINLVHKVEQTDVAKLIRLTYATFSHERKFSFLFNPFKPKLV
jgi:hypothetical protein